MGTPQERQAVVEAKLLQRFGYSFRDGQLRDASGGRFEFNMYSDRYANEERYEEVGVLVQEYVYCLLETDAGLERAPVPMTNANENSGTFIFMSPGALEKEKLMVLIHGSGAVRAGQWARSLIINTSLESGTQLPYIKEAIADGFGVIVMNTNDNKRLGMPIEESDSPKAHCLYVWESYVMTSMAKNIAIVAHSYGGILTMKMMDIHPNFFQNYVKAIAFTDSVHDADQRQHYTDYFKGVAQNWIRSQAALDTPLRSLSSYDCPCVSAGTDDHTKTSWKAMYSVFTFINNKM